ncbi:Apolipoprotein N-acyltransferase [bioreactor metagenome]|uniref:Apolipoprotein N-acyltransferase n=1 Tax=bioreactor metagenome TaxID=1076179 RepID=A0A645APA2_9ZZZZ|nr:carbon-nitrogen hydrolase family protein [Christensenella sp.]
MRIGAYQFAVSGSMEQNLQHFRRAIQQAAEESVRLLAFAECALTGYPGENVQTADAIDLFLLTKYQHEFEELASRHQMHLLFGAVERVDSDCFNSAYWIKPGEQARSIYQKRAIWGWDTENFRAGALDDGVIEIDGFRIGVRICYEVRFPEYFRELYVRRADCAVVLFADRSEPDVPGRYDLILAHLRTRAVENVMQLVSVNDSAIFQTAPTAAIDENGMIVQHLERHKEGLLVYELEKREELSFGATGRRFVSDQLMRIRR